MSYLIALPCIVGVYLHTRAMELPAAFFALGFLVVTVLLSSANIVQPGVDALVAVCVSMAAAYFCRWYLEREYQSYLEEDEEPVLKHSRKEHVSNKQYNFCSQLTHDFAVSAKDNVFAIQLVNTQDWSVLLDTLDGMSASQRQGFYANLNYSSVSEKSVQGMLEKYPENSDAHVLMGHVQLCKSKRLGLVPGVLPNEHTAEAVASAFRYFRHALRIQSDDAEAICGVLLAKSFISLREEHIVESLRRLLAQDPFHFHGLLVAARAIVHSARSANRFVDVVKECVSDPDSPTLAMAKVIAHVECLLIYPDSQAIDEKLLADMRKQVVAFKKNAMGLGAWQHDIAGNVIAFAHRLAGDYECMNDELKILDGKISPYPWQRDVTTPVTTASTVVNTGCLPG